jgi:hypothetical protein
VGDADPFVGLVEVAGLDVGNDGDQPRRRRALHQQGEAVGKNSLDDTGGPHGRAI